MHPIPTGGAAGRGDRTIDDSETIDLETADGVADAYLARPDDEPRPAVLLVMDAYGLRPQTERMADPIAARGFVVLAPNVFNRAGRAPVFRSPVSAIPSSRGGSCTTPCR